MSTNKPGATPSSGTFMVINFEPNPADDNADSSRIVLNYEIDPRLAEVITVVGETWLYQPSHNKSSSWEPLGDGRQTPGAVLGILRPRQGNGEHIALNLTWAFRPGSVESQNGWSMSGNFEIDNGRVQRYPRSGESTQTETLPEALQQMIDAFNPSSTTIVADPTATKDPTAPTTPGELSGPPSNGSGLSTGAIIGIAVGAGIAGLLLIGALVWFCCRRRRRRRRSGKTLGRPGTYGSDAATSQQAANKETHVNVAESPHSPYSEDGTFPPQQLRSHQSNHTREGVPLVDHVDAAPASRSSNVVAPFSDSNSPTQQSPVGSEPRSGARSVTPNVSHLIEEGMTEEEIRRLEEEERALDDAIQAAQGRRTAS
ncbi:hypothetical protein SODALDRAFT_323172 [Sodiomyces alkalinus F11]|uniref:Mid2 domain-containing protein n=1 Tax=Sodiomyces alkalinus (strain CBS 110278 / VKM F-3762 / F11) TaxID=1314773 RepID=A0A3N2PZJ8_SODAK|nr:hypothetical protein SODALDRAFT_323172 [Sodiomyces alkalinus F11]ROT39858.1 hypothetical protein SODALDRAFT_323172 [Sodiomyces alkalinus F11]